MSSDVARLRAQIDAENEAARRGLTGFAPAASHSAITARQQCLAEQTLAAIHAGQNPKEVLAAYEAQLNSQ